MPGTNRVEIRTLKVGRYVALEDSAYKILSMSKSKPGKHGSAKARLELESSLGRVMLALSPIPSTSQSLRRDLP